MATATAGMATPVDGNVGNCSGRTSQVRSPCRESASEFDTLTNPLWMARRFQGSAHVASRGAGRRLEPLLKRGQLAGGPRHNPVDVLDDLLQEAEMRETDRVVEALAADLQKTGSE